MQKIKNEKGVTLVALVITIIVTIMLASITMTIGMDSVNSTKDRKLQSELQMVGQATITEYSKALELNYIKEDDTIPANFIGDRIDNISIVTGIEYPKSKWVYREDEWEEYCKSEKELIANGNKYR